jgi:hypothetical protein
MWKEIKRDGKQFMSKYRHQGKLHD